MSRPGVLCGLVLLAGCGPRPASAGPETCAPATGTLASGASSGALAGEYRVRLVATSGPRGDSSTDGTLTLERVESHSHTGPRFSLRGHGEFRLEDVGAPAADVSSTDPLRPGVLGFDLPPTSGGTVPRLLLRLGAEVNRQDLQRVEGAYTVLRVRELGGNGFAGEWSSGDPMPTAEGFFCAWRNPPEQGRA